MTRDWPSRAREALDSSPCEIHIFCLEPPSRASLPASSCKGGRPQKEPVGVESMVVFLEEPRHFHVALRLTNRASFLPFKQALRARSALASRWSSSHTMMWSAVRYGVFTTARKLQVDAEPLPWTRSGAPFNLYAASQETWNSGAVKKRREEAERRAAAAALQPGAKKERVKFTVLDFKALVLSEGLWTRSAVLAHVQQKGSAEMQRWVGSRRKERERPHP